MLSNMRYMPFHPKRLYSWKLNAFFLFIQHKQSDVEMLLPIVIGDYTDFYSSLHHAKNCGTIFRGAENPILPNW